MSDSTLAALEANVQGTVDYLTELLHHFDGVQSCDDCTAGADCEYLEYEDLGQYLSEGVLEIRPVWSGFDKDYQYAVVVFGTGGPHIEGRFVGPDHSFIEGWWGSEHVKRYLPGDVAGTISDYLAEVVE